MIEPHCEIASRTGLTSSTQDYDFTDEIARIDRIENCDDGKFNQMMSFGSSTIINGGTAMPRVGR
jgi:hypothetical protein